LKRIAIVEMNEANIFRKQSSFFLSLASKTGGLDHIWPELIDHKKPELSTCFLVIYGKCNLTGQMWSTHPAFAPLLRYRIESYDVNYL
jgi:hypothetical protein